MVTTNETHPLVVGIQTVKGKAQVPVVDLTLTQSSGDEFVPMDAGIGFSDAHGIENVFNFFFGECPE